MWHGHKRGRPGWLLRTGQLMKQQRVVLCMSVQRSITFPYWWKWCKEFVYHGIFGIHRYGLMTGEGQTDERLDSSTEPCTSILLWAASWQNQQYRSNFGEVDVAPAKNDKVNKVEKWQKLTPGLNPNHMHIFKPWKKRCAKLHKGRHEIV